MRTLGRALYRNLRSCIRLPQGYYIAALVLAVLLFFLFRKEKMGKRLAISLLCPYLFLVLGSTVLKRRTYIRYMHYFMPFHSWRIILRNGFRRSSYQLAQVLLNVLLLSPIGLLMPVFVKRKRLVVLFGFCFSLMIETLQLVLRRGYFETDDLIHNTLGVAIACGCFAIGERIIGSINQKSCRSSDSIR